MTDLVVGLPVDGKDYLPLALVEVTTAIFPFSRSQLPFFIG